MTEYLSVREVRDLLRWKSDDAVRDLIISGRLRATKPSGKPNGRWLIRRTDLDAMLLDNMLDRDGVA